MTAQARTLGGRYQVGELLGYGGMAEVHAGRDSRLGRDVAIKVLRSDLARDSTFQLRFRREAQNAASLNHPAIVAVYDTGEDEGPNSTSVPYIVMEYVNGRTLKEVLTAEGRLQPRRALEVTAEICSALEFSHRHGIIHRDIKPGNVMLTRNGQVKVMDFGIARALASGATTMTQTSAVIGTAQYLSPEQARGETVDARSDVYATGCVLYELLCGHPPFVGDNPVSVAYQHVREDPRPPSDGNPDVTPAIDAIVLKALAKNPANRYQSAREMRDDVLRAVAGRPVAATPVLPVDERTAVMPAVGRGATPTRRHEAVPAGVGDPSRRKNSRKAIIALIVVGVLALAALGTGLYLANSKPKADVPSVIGKEVNAATEQLTKAKFVVEKKLVNAPISECKKDTVQSQDPPGGRKVVEGSTVNLTVCTGPKKVKVPNLVNLSYDNAAKQLADLKLQAEPAEDPNSDREPGTVLKQSVAAGTEVDESTKVTLTIPASDRAKVPDLLGKSEAEARQAIINVKLKPVVQYTEAEKPEDVGKVVGQDPGAGTLLKKQSNVTITVAKAKPSPTPDRPTSKPPTNTPTPKPSQEPGREESAVVRSATPRSN